MSSNTDFSWEMSDWESALGISSADLSDEIKGIDESKALKTSKTKEEIERYMVDEGFDDVQKTLHILKLVESQVFHSRNGAVVQKSWAISNLPKLLESNPQDVTTKVIPTLHSLVQNDPPPLQLLYGKIISECLAKKAFQETFVHLTLFPFLKKIAIVNDIEWQDVLLSIYKILPPSILENEVLPDAIVQGGLSQPVPFRLWCCKILGTIAQLIPGRSLTTTKSELLDEYMELLIDEHEDVRISAIENFSNLIEFLDADSKSDIVWPFWKQVLSETQSDQVNLIVSKSFGIVLFNLKEILSYEDLSFVLDSYKIFASSSNAQIRLNAAYNFPAVLKVVQVERFEEYSLADTLNSFVQGELPLRIVISKCFHELCTIMGRKSSRYIKEHLKTLLNDDEIVVVLPIMEKIQAILEQNQDEETLEVEPEFYKILTSLPVKFPNAKWRDQVILMNAYEVLTLFFPSEIVMEFNNQEVLPLIFRKELPRPVIIKCLRCLVVSLRYLKGFENREALLKIFIQDLGKSAIFRDRMMFLDCVELMIKIFSRRYIRETILTDFLDLSKDAIVNIRLKMCLLAKQLTKCLYGIPKDNLLVIKWQEVFQKLCNDKDMETKMLAKEVLCLKIDGTASNRSSTASLNADVIPLDDDDLFDIEKEDEEEKQRQLEVEMVEANRRRELEDARLDFSRRLNLDFKRDKTSAKIGTSVKPSMKKTSTSNSRSNSSTKLATPVKPVVNPPVLASVPSGPQKRGKSATLATPTNAKPATKSSTSNVTTQPPPTYTAVHSKQSSIGKAPDTSAVPRSHKAPDPTPTVTTSGASKKTKVLATTKVSSK